MRTLSLVWMTLLLVTGAAHAQDVPDRTVRTGGEMSLAAEQNTATVVASALLTTADTTEVMIQERLQRLRELQQQVRDLPLTQVEVRCCR